MNDVLITYDIAEGKGEESKHTEVKDAMKALGYMQSFNYGEGTDKKKYYLPNTSLWKKDTTSSTAVDDLLKVAKEKKAEVERVIATKFEGWTAIQGKEYKSK